MIKSLHAKLTIKVLAGDLKHLRLQFKTVNTTVKPDDQISYLQYKTITLKFPTIPITITKKYKTAST